jgi:hypothetical protein
VRLGPADTFLSVVVVFCIFFTSFPFLLACCTPFFFWHSFLASLLPCYLATLLPCCLATLLPMAPCDDMCDLSFCYLDGRSQPCWTGSYNGLHYFACTVNVGWRSDTESQFSMSWCVFFHLRGFIDRGPGCVEGLIAYRPSGGVFYCPPAVKPQCSVGRREGAYRLGGWLQPSPLCLHYNNYAVFGYRHLLLP